MHCILNSQVVTTNYVNTICSMASAVPATNNPLYFFYDCEGSGGSSTEAAIIQVAAVLYTKNLCLTDRKAAKLSEKHFTSLCYTDKRPQLFVSLMTGIRQEQLDEAPRLAAVLKKFFIWIKKTLSRVEEKTQKRHFPILVAHKGKDYDFPLLINEIKRIGSPLLDQLRELNLHFADTLVLCERLRSNNDPILRGSKAIGVSALHKMFFPEEEYREHRALEDAKALCKVFTDSPLAGLVSELRLQTTENLLSFPELKATLGKKARKKLRRQALRMQPYARVPNKARSSTSIEL